MRLLARASSASLYIVGGSVRDLLLGRGIRDLDLVTEGDAPKLAAMVSEQTGGKLTAHSRFGTATVETHGLRLDFSTARDETYPQPGALPQVRPSGMRDDLRRRDFSINAMALCLSGPAEGSLLDPCGGQADLQQGIVRVLHQASFIDDPTRIFRAVRYEQRLGFTIEQDTLRMLREALLQNRVNTLSGDRVRRELELMLEEGRPVPALRRAGELGLLAAIHPALSVGIGNLTETERAHHPLELLARTTFSMSPEAAEALIARLNMPLEWSQAVRDAVALQRIACLLDTQDDLRPSQVVELLRDRNAYALRAMRHLCTGQRIRERLDCYLAEWRNCAPALNGHDLKDLGVIPGPATGRILKELKRARLDQQVSDRDDEIALVKRLLEQSEQEVMEDAVGTA